MKYKLGLESLHQKKAFMSILAACVLGSCAGRRLGDATEMIIFVFYAFAFVLVFSLCVGEVGVRGQIKRSVEPGVVLYIHNPNTREVDRTIKNSILVSVCVHTMVYCGGQKRNCGSLSSRCVGPEARSQLSNLATSVSSSAEPSCQPFGNV